MTRSSKPKVVYWNNIPTPYIEGRFRAIAERGNIEFEGWFNSVSEPGRSWTVTETGWGFSGRYVRQTRLAGRALHLPTAELQRAQPDVLISLFSTTSFVLGSMMASAMGTRVVWRIVPTFDTWIRRTRVKEATKHLLFRAVDGAKVPGPDGAAVALRYGIPSDRILPSTQSIDVDHFSRPLRRHPERVREYRQRLGFEGFVFLYVGRILGAKGLDTLLSAYRKARSMGSCSLVLVGDGADLDSYKLRSADLPDVHFLGFRPPEDLPDIYALADAVVFPTLGDVHGLVVDEAMAAGKPVISSTAAGDISARIEQGTSGFIFPVGHQDELAKMMMHLMRDPELARSMGEAASRSAAAKTHDRWAQDVEHLVDQILSLPRRRSASAAAFRAAGGAIRRLSIEGRSQTPGSSNG